MGGSRQGLTELRFKVERVPIETCQKMLGYTFKDPDLLTRALTHSSVAPTRSQSNERMEFLGDAVLGMVVCQKLYEHDDQLSEGDMTKIKSLVVSRQTCAEVAEESQIATLVSIGKGMSHSAGPPRSVVAAVIEAIIGAIYLDGGLEPARDFILKLLQPNIDQALNDEHHSNFKSLLQQHTQRQWNTTPIYHLLDEKGPDHSKAFEIAVSAGGHNFPSAWGKTKKQAEQEAAKRALVKLNLLDEEDLQGPSK